MPAIIKSTPLSLSLKNVLNTNPNEWKKFYDSIQIKEIFSELAFQIEKHNFFYVDYSISTFLDFLKTYANAKFTEVELNRIDREILQKFNKVWIQLHDRIINQKELNTTHCNIVKDYMGFVRNLLGPEPRHLFTKSEITFKALDFQKIGNMLDQNSISINEALIENYTSLLKLSFDTPKFLSHFEWDLGISGLARTIFLSKQIDSHFAVTRFFDLLGYQGQLLDYYRNTTYFNITQQLLTDANEELKKNVIELQTYYFNNLKKRDDIDRPLLQHYLYTYFFKVIYKKHPQKLEALKRDSYLLNYIKLDYVALPNRFDCQAYLPIDKTTIIEYKNLTSPETACQAIACSSKSYEQWQQTLGFHASAKSNYIFRVADSYEKYSVTYAYGYAPTAGGFYLSGELKNNIIHGQAYSYYSDKHQFIEVSRHEAVHHDNFKLYFAAQNINPEITFFTNRNFNEGLAVLFAGGACAPGYISQDFSNITAPNLDTLLNIEYIGYSTSWLYNNYFIQQYSERNKNFYSDLLQLNKTVFKDKWISILNQDKAYFYNWLSVLKQACQNAPNELSIENCPSIYLTDYSTIVELNKQTMTITTFKVSESPNLGFLLPQKLTVDEMGRNLIFKISEGKFDEFRILLENGANPNFFEDNTGNTPLHFLYFYGNCNVQYLELLLEYHPKIIRNHEGQFPLEMAEKRCNAMDLLKIQEAFSRYARQQKLLLTITIPIASFVNGVISGWSEEMAQRNSKSRYIPNIIFYGVKPVTLAISNSAINILLGGSAEAIGLDDIGLSFTYYLVMNYLGLMLAQFGERITNKCKNKFLSIVMSISLYAFFLNPSLLVLLLTEGLIAINFQSVLQPLLSLLSGGIFFKAGEYSVQKAYEKFFPINSAGIVNSHPDYFLSYSPDKSPKEISADEKVLTEIKEKLFQLTLSIKKHINKQVYQLNFKEDLQSASEAISILIEKIHKESKELVEYKAEFTALEKSLNNIQSALTQLNQCSSETKIQSLWNATTQLLTNLRGIRPLPQTNKVPDVLPQPEPIKEEQTMPLMVSFSNPKESQPQICNRYTRPPTIFGRMKNVFFIRPSAAGSGFPKPPTEQELQEMGLFDEKSNENSRKFYQNRG